MVIVGVIAETAPGESRVALTPAVVPALTSAGIEVVVAAGAGAAAGFSDDAYREKGARVASREEALAAQVIARVQATDSGDILPDSAVGIGMCRPLAGHPALRELAERGVTVFAMELMPRITRAQSMDALSSQATIAGYKAALLAALNLPKIFPMMTTAAGTLAPARVLVVGAGVAGLQAIATSRRLGAVVEAYDVRPASKEQVESLGAKFVELPLETGDAEEKSGYAKAQDEEFYRRQREMMARVVAASDAVITTAQVPGKKAPVLVTAEMVKGMSPGSVIVDIAAEQGGNCELTKPDETVVQDGVTILGPTNLPATVPTHASQMYAKNISSFLANLVKDGELRIDLEDEITRETLVSRGGEIVQPRVREAFGLAPIEAAPEAAPPAATPPAADASPDAEAVPEATPPDDAEQKEATP
ncbi:MAG TPA: Re/Si-specific NAD(P)(+) transhydrogenase subunit alpha [Candidatus Solibacter sp.]|jgi:NAD(P) transhydrogenase subunit alpha|nr:Re/Si-specific NAD(P)(+) transhydrogenase subunit alpha [Candidatus Solibacter sp.]